MYTCIHVYIHICVYEYICTVYGMYAPYGSILKRDLSYRKRDLSVYGMYAPYGSILEYHAVDPIKPGFLYHAYVHTLP